MANRSPPVFSEIGQRRERGAVASQACETCRNRKTKCDEARPACGLCRRLNLDCVYREPVPTKKDKTLVHILESLHRLELKVDHAITSNTITPEKSVGTETSTQPASENDPADEAYSHLTPPHQVILWPSIYVLLSNSGNLAAADSQNILQQGTAWFLQHEMNSESHGFPCDDVSGSFPPTQEALLHNYQALTNGYFENFNVLCPILSREHFIRTHVMPSVERGCRGNDAKTVLTLLVLALGDVATHGVTSRSINSETCSRSGFRGGTLDRPPGLLQFNEAMKRVGFVMTQISLEVVQIMLLTATYYESSAKHLAFWKAAVSASITCQAVIKSTRVDWTTAYGHALKQAYWACTLNECLYHHDLDFPKTGIEDFADEVPAPSYYDDVYSQDTPSSEDRTESRRHFLALVTLRQIIARIHDVTHKSSANSTVWQDANDSGRLAIASDLSDQLEIWRHLLPGPLQWVDTDRFAFPYIYSSASQPTQPLLTVSEPPFPIAHRFNLDVMVAQLRTRYYYARFMIYRPFIWRALHVGDSMTSDDDDYCALAIKSALMWPICMAPPRSKKRLVPHHFTWTQNFIGILLVLRMRQENRCLERICDERIKPDDLQSSIVLMLEWLKDMRQFDGIADWGWKVLEPLYAEVIITLG